MNKVAIVVQRCDESVVGGSESLAWQYADLLKSIYDVDVLTTTATDIRDWANVLSEGAEHRSGVRIRRFRVTQGRTEHWGRLLERLYADYDALRNPPLGSSGDIKHLPWTIALQEEFIRTQGPYSEPLNEFLRDRWPDYKAIIFTTYLYPTTYFGLYQVPKQVALLAPTLHDEPTAYLSAFKYAAQRARSVVWLSDAERRVGRELWGELPGRIVALSVDVEPREEARLDYPFILYCGRIDPNKGCLQLFDYFLRFKEQTGSNIRLILTGKAEFPVPSHPDIEFRGFVDDNEKLSLMAGAKLFVMPSGNESLSIVTLEAMAQSTPLLASSTSEVIVDHVRLSGGGEIYSDFETFCSQLSRMLENQEALTEMGQLGRRYVLSRFTRERVRASLMREIESCVEVMADASRFD
jgi:glycosyltransferase involved in cell wall biosynthesis